MSEYTNEHGGRLPESVVKLKPIPGQIASSDISKVVNVAGIITSISTKVIIAGSFVSNIFFAVSMGPLWSLINALQVVYCVMLFHLRIPGNLHAFIEFFEGITKLEFFDLDAMLRDEVYIPEYESTPLNFVSAGIETPLALVNLLVALFLLFLQVCILVIFLLVAICAKRSECCRK